MSKVTFIQEDGKEVVVEEAEGSLMEVAIDNGIEGIDADCGGVGSCATCHVRVKREWMEKVGKAEEFEQDMLDLEDNANECSRLSCQVEITDDHDGLVVEVVKLI